MPTSTASNPKRPASGGVLFFTPPTTHQLRIYAQQMQQTHRMTPDRDAKSAISGQNLPLPKLNVEGSISFARFPNQWQVPRPRGIQ